MKEKLQTKSLIQGLPSVESIPVLSPDKALDAIRGAGQEGYEFIEALRVPAEGSGGVYTADYFRSFLEYLKRYPVPGSKDGHAERVQDDFYTIGGSLRMENDTEGVCYLRVYVPFEGWNSSNAGLIRSLKTGTPELSIVADVQPERGQDGRNYFTRELGKPRNDLVHEGAMEQSISNHKNDKKEQQGMTKEEIIAAIKTAVMNNTLTLEEIAKEVKMENKIRNAEDEQREKLAKAIRETLELPEDATAAELIKAVEDIFKEIEEGAEAVAEAEVNKLSGGRKLKNALGMEEPNPAFDYAMSQVKGRRGKRLNRALQDLKNDRVFNALISQKADPYSPANLASVYGAGAGNGFPGIREA